MADPKQTPQQRLYQQIETDADYYQPSIYSLLTRFDSYKIESDPDALGFIPLTTAQQGLGYQAKFLPFVIGLIPPSANVTGNLLDRSASISAIAPPALPEDVGPNTPAKNAKMQGTKPFPGGSPIPGEPGSDRGPPIVYQYSKTEVAAAIRDAYREKYHRDPSPQELAIYVTQSYVETGGQWPNNNPGGIGNLNPPDYPKEAPPIHGHIPPGVKTYGVWGDSIQSPNGAGKSAIRYFYSYDTAKDGGAHFLKAVGNGIPAAGTGNVDDYVAAIGRSGYYGNPSEILPANEGGNGVMTREQKYRQLFGTPEALAALTKSLTPVASLPSVDDPQDNSVLADSGPGTWNKDGAKNAQDAGKDRASQADKDLNQSDVGRQLLDAQRVQTMALTAAISNMAQTPPLQMLVNPSSFKFSSEKILSDGNWGRNGPIIQMWGNQQEKIEGSGKLAAFYALDATGSAQGNGSSGNGPGLTRTARNFSLSYQNFLSLYLLYKSNGGIWLEDYYSNSHSKEKRVNLTLVGSVYIYYDSTLYVGSFDSFSITETDTAPFTLEYSFSFTVRAWFLLDRTQDPRMTYGSTAHPSIASAPIQVTGVNDVPVMSDAEVAAWQEKLATEQAAYRARDAIDANLRGPADFPPLAVPPLDQQTLNKLNPTHTQKT